MKFSSTGFGNAIIDDTPPPPKRDPNVKICKCNTLAVKKMSKSEKSNGRFYWACPLPKASACQGWIAWVDDEVANTTKNVAISVSKTLIKANNGASSSSSSSSNNLLCNCGEPAVERTSGSANNKDRLYFACSKPRDSQCRYFQWTDEIGKAKKPKTHIPAGETFLPENIETFFINYMVEKGRRELQPYEKRFKEVAEAMGFEVVTSCGYSEAIEYKSFWVRKGEYFKDYDAWVFICPLGGDGMYELPLTGTFNGTKGWIKDGQASLIAFQGLKGFYMVDRKALWRYLDGNDKEIVHKSDYYKVIKVTNNDLTQYDKENTESITDAEELANLQLMVDHWSYKESSPIMEEPSEI